MKEESRTHQIYEIERKQTRNPKIVTGIIAGKLLTRKLNILLHIFLVLLRFYQYNLILFLSFLYLIGLTFQEYLCFKEDFMLLTQKDKS